MEKSRTKEQSKSFHPIRPDESEQVERIAGECFSRIGIDFVEGNRIKHWELKRKLWEPEVLKKYHRVEGFRCDVLTVGTEVVGYLSYCYAKKAVVIDEIGVKPIHRRQGHATYMVERIKASAEANKNNASGRKVIGVKVPEKNLAAQLFFRQCGFRWVKTLAHGRSGYDTYAMQYEVQC